jgi:hypothetical protein
MLDKCEKDQNLTETGGRSHTVTAGYVLSPEGDIYVEQRI